MKNIHIMSIDWLEGETREACVERLVEAILRSFPDAMVEGPPTDEVNPDQMPILLQEFTSETFDSITTSVAAQIINELQRMIEQVANDDDFPATEEEKRIGASVLVAAYTHLYHRFIGEEYE
jgi:hypothetical protein